MKHNRTNFSGVGIQRNDLFTDAFIQNALYESSKKISTKNAWHDTFSEDINNISSIYESFPCKRNKIQREICRPLSVLSDLSHKQNSDSTAFVPFTNFDLQREKITIAESKLHVVRVKLSNSDHGLILEKDELCELVHMTIKHDKLLHGIKKDTEYVLKPFLRESLIISKKRMPRFIVHVINVVLINEAIPRRQSQSGINR